MAYFWADSGPVLWQNALRYISGSYLNDIGESARMYALAEAALADAQIACWDSKYFYDFWRPITAIRLGDQDGNPTHRCRSQLAAADRHAEFSRVSLLVTFDISGAISHMLQLFFRSDVLSFQMTTTNVLALQKTRTFTRLVAGGAGGPRRACVVGHPLPQLGHHRQKAGPPCFELGV